MNADTSRMIDRLCEYDTPSITNVVATYPESSGCLGLYNPWATNWYTDRSVRCIYPDLGPRAGYAVTCIWGLPDPSFDRLSFIDLLEILHASPKPTILVIEQRFPSEIAGKVGLGGLLMASSLKAVGCAGLISNGPARDVDDVRALQFQYLLGGITPGHGPLALHAVNVPVSVAGMDVAPGEMLHMDGNGACKFPADKLQAVLDQAKVLREEERAAVKKIQDATSSEDLRAVFQSHSYGARQDEG